MDKRFRKLSSLRHTKHHRCAKHRKITFQQFSQEKKVSKAFKECDVIESEEESWASDKETISWEKGNPSFFYEDISSEEDSLTGVDKNMCSQQKNVNEGLTEKDVSERIDILIKSIRYKCDDVKCRNSPEPQRNEVTSLAYKRKCLESSVGVSEMTNKMTRNNNNVLFKDNNYSHCETSSRVNFPPSKKTFHDNSEYTGLNHDCNYKLTETVTEKLWDHQSDLSASPDVNEQSQLESLKESYCAKLKALEEELSVAHEINKKLSFLQVFDRRRWNALFLRSVDLYSCLKDDILRTKDQLKAKMCCSQERVKEEEAKEKEIKFVYTDSGSHWCEICHFIASNAEEFLLHLFSSHHSKFIKPDSKIPWADNNLQTSKFLEPKAAENIQGSQFIASIPCNYYCSLCKCFTGNNQTSLNHLCSQEHNSIYEKCSARAYFESKIRDLAKEAFVLSKSKKNKEKLPVVTFYDDLERQYQIRKQFKDIILSQSKQSSKSLDKSCFSSQPLNQEPSIHSEEKPCISEKPVVTLMTLNILSSGRRSVSLQWEPVKHLQNFKMLNVYYKQPSCHKWFLDATLPNTSTTHTIEHLYPGQEYEFSLGGVSELGETIPVTSVVTVETESCPEEEFKEQNAVSVKVEKDPVHFTECIKQEDDDSAWEDMDVSSEGEPDQGEIEKISLNSSDIGLDFIELTWPQANIPYWEKATNLLLHMCSLQSGVLELAETLPLNASNYKVLNLNPGSEYKFELRLRYLSGSELALSETYECKTAPEDKGKEDKDDDLEAQILGETRISSISETFTETCGMKIPVLSSCRPDITSFSCPDQMEGTSKAVGQLKVDSVKNNSISLSWRIPDYVCSENVRNYVVEMFNEWTNDWLFYSVIQPPRTTYVANRLNPGKVYMFRVVAKLTSGSDISIGEPADVFLLPEGNVVEALDEKDVSCIAAAVKSKEVTENYSFETVTVKDKRTEGGIKLSNTSPIERVERSGISSEKEPTLSVIQNAAALGKVKLNENVKIEAHLQTSTVTTIWPTFGKEDENKDLITVDDDHKCSETRDHLTETVTFKSSMETTFSKLNTEKAQYHCKEMATPNQEHIKEKLCMEEKHSEKTCENQLDHLPEDYCKNAFKSSVDLCISEKRNPIKQNTVDVNDNVAEKASGVIQLPGESQKASLLGVNEGIYNVGKTVKSAPMETFAASLLVKEECGLEESCIMKEQGENSPSTENVDEKISSVLIPKFDKGDSEVVRNVEQMTVDKELSLELCKEEEKTNIEVLSSDSVKTSTEMKLIPKNPLLSPALNKNSKDCKVEVSSVTKMLAEENVYKKAKKPAAKSSKNGKLKVVKVTSRTISLTWKIPSGVSSSEILEYLVQRFNVQKYTWKRVSCVPSSKTSYCICQLQPEESYVFRVRAIMVSGHRITVGQTSQVKTLKKDKESQNKRKEERVKSPKRGELQFCILTKDSICLTWGPPRRVSLRDIDSYQVLQLIVKKNYSEWPVVKSVPPSVTSFTVTELVGLVHTFRIEATLKSGRIISATSAVKVCMSKKETDPVLKEHIEEVKARPCKYWPNCKKGHTCDFLHSGIICKYFPYCKLNKECPFLHPNCAFGSSCSKMSRCIFTHPFEITAKRKREAEQSASKEKDKRKDDGIKDEKEKPKDKYLETKNLPEKKMQTRKQEVETLNKENIRCGEIKIASSSSSTVSLFWKPFRTFSEGFLRAVMVQRSIKGRGCTWLSLCKLSPSERSYTVTIIPGNSYRYRIIAETVKGSNIVLAKPVEFVAPKGDIEIEKQGPDFVTLKWTKLNIPKGLKSSLLVLYRQDVPCETWQEVTTIDFKRRYFRMTGLSPEKDYKFQLKLRDKDGSETVLTNELCTRITGEVEKIDLEILRKGPDFITLQWAELNIPKNLTSSSLVLYRQDIPCETWHAVSTLDCRRRYFLMTGLSPGKDYKFQLKLWAEGDLEIVLTNELCTRTTDCEIEPEQRKFGVRGRGVRICWKPPLVRVMYYLVEILQYGAWVQITTLPPSMRSYVVKKLVPRTAYSLRVRAKLKTGQCILVANNNNAVTSET